MEDKKEKSVIGEIIILVVFMLIGGINVDKLFEGFSFFSLILVIVSFIVIVSILIKR